MVIVNKEQLIFELMNVINKKYNNPNMFIYFYYLLGTSDFKGGDFYSWMGDRTLSNYSRISEEIITDLRKRLNMDGFISKVKKTDIYYVALDEFKINVDFILNSDNLKKEDYIEVYKVD